MAAYIDVIWLLRLEFCFQLIGAMTRLHVSVLEEVVGRFWLPHRLDVTLHGQSRIHNVTRLPNERRMSAYMLLWCAFSC